MAFRGEEAGKEAGNRLKPGILGVWGTGRREKERGPTGDEEKASQRSDGTQRLDGCEGKKVKGAAENQDAPSKKLEG